MLESLVLSLMEGETANQGEREHQRERLSLVEKKRDGPSQYSQKSSMSISIDPSSKALLAVLSAGVHQGT